MLTEPNELVAYESLPPDSQAVIVALALLMDRISRMPQADKDDLFDLVNHWKKAKTREEARSAHGAMNEILTQTPVVAQPLRPSAGGGKPTGKRKAWAEHVGRTVRRLRDEAGMTQVELAKKAGIPQPHLCRVETAELSATHKTLKRIAVALGVDVGQLDSSAG